MVLGGLFGENKDRSDVTNGFLLVVVAVVVGSLSMGGVARSGWKEVRRGETIGIGIIWYGLLINAQVVVVKKKRTTTIVEHKNGNAVVFLLIPLVIIAIQMVLWWTSSEESDYNYFFSQDL